MYRNNRMEKMAEIEKVIFMNMCMVYDHAGRVLALDKVGKSYSGTTFPGGHVEPGETFTEINCHIICDIQVFTLLV